MYVDPQSYVVLNLALEENKLCLFLTVVSDQAEG